MMLHVVSLVSVWCCYTAVLSNNLLLYSSVHDTNKELQIACRPNSYFHCFLVCSHVYVVSLSSSLYNFAACMLRPGTDNRAQEIGCISEVIAFLLHKDSGAVVAQIHPQTPNQDQASPSCVRGPSLDNKYHTNKTPAMILIKLQTHK